MHFLLEWCIAQIKKLLGFNNDINATLASLQNQIDALSGGGGISASIQHGSGNPEGVAEASAGQWYFDDDALPTGQTMYMNTATSGNTGWINCFQIV